MKVSRNRHPFRNTLIRRKAKRVAIKESGESGTIIGRAQYTTRSPDYLWKRLP